VRYQEVKDDYDNSVWHIDQPVWAVRRRHATSQTRRLGRQRWQRLGSISYNSLVRRMQLDVRMDNATDAQYPLRLSGLVGVWKN